MEQGAAGEVVVFTEIEIEGFDFGGALEPECFLLLLQVTGDGDRSNVFWNFTNNIAHFQAIMNQLEW